MQADHWKLYRIRPGVWEVRCPDCDEILDTDIDGFANRIEMLEGLDTNHKCKGRDD